MERKIRTIAGILSSLPHLLLSPLNLLKTRLQARNIPLHPGKSFLKDSTILRERESLKTIVRSIYRNEGKKAFWNGTLVSSASIVMIGLFFFLQNTFRNTLYTQSQISGKV